MKGKEIKVENLEITVTTTTDKNASFYASIRWLALTVAMGWAIQAIIAYGPPEPGRTMTIMLLGAIGVRGFIMTMSHAQQWVRDTRDTFPTLSRANISAWANTNPEIAILMAIVIGVTTSTMFALLVGAPWNIGAAMAIAAASACGILTYILLYVPKPPTGGDSGVLLLLTILATGNINAAEPLWVVEKSKPTAFYGNTATPRPTRKIGMAEMMAMADIDHNPANGWDTEGFPRFSAEQKKKLRNLSFGPDVEQWFPLPLGCPPIIVMRWRGGEERTVDPREQKWIGTPGLLKIFWRNPDFAEKPPPSIRVYVGDDMQIHASDRSEEQWVRRKDVPWDPELGIPHDAKCVGTKQTTPSMTTTRSTSSEPKTAPTTSVKKTKLNDKELPLIILIVALLANQAYYVGLNQIKRRRR